MEINLV